jgi:hypothetical protein
MPQQEINSINIVIVGNGIAGQLLLFHISKILNKSKTKIKANIYHFFDDELASNSSLNSSGIASTFGAQKGISLLGDTICESFNCLKKFVEDEKPKGVVNGNMYFFEPYENDLNFKLDFLKRYNNCQNINIHEEKFFNDFLYNVPFADLKSTKKIHSFFFHPEEFKKWIINKSKKYLIDNNYLNKKELVIQISNDYVLDRSGNKTPYDFLFLATGSMLKKFDFIYKDINIDLSSQKLVSGSFLELNDIDLSKFNNYQIPDVLGMKLYGTEVVLNSFYNSIYLGNTSLNTPEISCIEIHNIKEIYSKIYNDLSGVLSLPKFSISNLKSGVRLKAKKRLPYWGRITNKYNSNSKIYSIHGLYKNGYIYSFYGAETLSKLFENDLNLP